MIVPDTDSTYAAIFFGGKATFAVLFGSNPNVLNEILHFESKVKLWKAQCTTEFTKSPEMIKTISFSKEISPLKNPQKRPVPARDFEPKIPKFRHKNQFF